MRVISGTAKGRSLKCPKGPRIRPTSDRVREAIFSALESLDIDWSSALDLYAGTGALGIEALSRGAKRADFVEHDPKCCSTIMENLQHTGFLERTKVYRSQAHDAIRILGDQYSLIFLDPPYSDYPDESFFVELVSSRLPGTKATIVIEHSKKLNPRSSYGDFKKKKSLRHGDTHVSIYQREGGGN